MSSDAEKTVMVFVFHDGNIILSRRLNTWFGDNQFAVPGGLVDAGEEPEDAAIRELFEETNITTSPESLVLFDQRQTKYNDRKFDSYYFYTDVLEGSLQNNEPNRHAELDWYPINNLPKETMPLITELMKKIPLCQI